MATVHDEEKKAQPTFKDKSYTFTKQMELELRHASSIPSPDARAVQEQLDGHIHGATSERRNITRQASETTSYESNEQPKTNQHIEDATS